MPSTSNSPYKYPLNVPLLFIPSFFLPFFDRLYSSTDAATPAFASLSSYCLRHDNILSYWKYSGCRSKGTLPQFDIDLRFTRFQRELVNESSRDLALDHYGVRGISPWKLGSRYFSQHETLMHTALNASALDERALDACALMHAPLCMRP
jgi:hypothetical protein